MRILLVISALLFITGVQAHYIVQQDGPQEEQPVIYKFLRDAEKFAYNLRRNLEDSEIVKEYKIKEKLYAAMDNVNDMLSEIVDHIEKAWKKIEAFSQKFPVFTEKVRPILEDFANSLEDQAEDDAKKILNTGIETLRRMDKYMTAYLRKVETIAGERRDELRSKIVALRNKAQPYMDDVREEYNRYLKSM